MPKRLKPILAIVGAFLVLSFGAALLTNDDTRAERVANQPDPTPAPTTTAAAGESAPETVPTSPAPRRSQLFSANGEPINLGPATTGERCSIVNASSDDEGDAPLLMGSFEIPTGMATDDCVHLSFVGAPPLGASVTARLTTTRPMLSLERQIALGEQTLVTELDYQPVNGAVAYQVAFEPTSGPGMGVRRVIAVRPTQSEADGGWLTVEAFSTEWDGPELAQAAGVVEVISDSITWTGETSTTAPVEGGICSGDGWFVEVPDDWFSFRQCAELNTSADAPLFVRNDGRSPILMLEVPRNEPLNGEVLERADGLRYTVSEGRTRTITVELPTSQLIIDGAQEIDHALPGHTWDDTVDAMQALVDNLQVLPVDTTVAVESRLRASPRTSALSEAISITPVDNNRWLISDTAGFAGTTAIETVRQYGARGLVTRTDGALTFSGQLSAPDLSLNYIAGILSPNERCESNAVDLPVSETDDGATWTIEEPCGNEIDIVIDAAAESGPSSVERFGCAQAEGTFSPRAFFDLEVDVDGDGADEWIVVPLPATDTPDTPIEVWVVFDDGSSLVDVIDGSFLRIDNNSKDGVPVFESDVRWSAQRLALAGEGFETFAIINEYEHRQRYSELFEVADCEVRVVTVLESGSTTGWCATEPSPETGEQQVRTWAWPDVDIAAGESDRGRLVRDNSNELCGPEIPLAALDGPGTELAGVYQLTLQQEDRVIEAQIRLRAAGEGTYLATRERAEDEVTVDELPVLVFVNNLSLWLDGMVESDGTTLRLTTAQLAFGQLFRCPEVEFMLDADGSWVADLSGCGAQAVLRPIN